jgi:hypothetical protein
LVGIAVGGAVKFVETIFGLNKKNNPPAGAVAAEVKQDVFASIIAEESPHRIVYGRARVGGSIVAVLTSGDFDQYKHIVCVHANHECEDIETIYLNGVAVSEIDIYGIPQSGDYANIVKTTAADGISGTGGLLNNTPIDGTVRIFWNNGNVKKEELSYTRVGKTITGLPNRAAYTVNYEYNKATSPVRILKQLGATGQAGNPTMIAEIPNAKWTFNHMLSGMTYSIIRVDLTDDRFKSGMPEVEAIIKGKKLHDVRSIQYPNDTPVWSENPALALADYLTSDICGVPMPVVVHYSGTAVGGSDKSISLPAGASSIQNDYKGMKVRIISGTGAGQIRDVIQSAKNIWKNSEVITLSDNPNAVVLYANTIADPFGGTLADRVVPSASSSYNFISETVSALTNETYAFSIFIKHLAIDDSSFSIYFGKSNYQGGGSIDFSAVGGVISSSSTDVKIVSYGNGWYRIEKVQVLTIDCTDLNMTFGGISADVALFGKQIEKSSYVSGYIQTDNAAGRVGAIIDKSWAVRPDATSVFDVFGENSDFPLSDYITAANVCDEVVTSGAWSGNRYTINGVISADQSQSGVIDEIAKCMAGEVVATTWGLTAGKYVAPIMALSQSDIVGDLSFTAGIKDSELFNGIKGKFRSAENQYVSTDFAPYQNAAYLAVDGAEVWNDISFDFTNEKQRVHNLCRIQLEDQRSSFIIQADFSYKTWALRIGDRVSFTSSFLNQVNKVYRVAGKSFGSSSAISLTLKEDSASIWDLADAVVADVIPSTGLPNLYFTEPPIGLIASESLYETTNSSGVKVKLHLEWSIPAESNIYDYIVEYKKYEDAHYTNSLNSFSKSLDIFDFPSGSYDFRVYARSNLRIRSAPSSKLTYKISGLALPPEVITGFTVKPFNNYAVCNWDRTTSLDVKIGGDVEIRVCQNADPSWEKATIIPDAKFNGDATSANVSLVTGRYFAKFIDSSGQYSPSPAYFDVTEALITGFTTVSTVSQHPTFAGDKVNCGVFTNNLRITSYAAEATYDFNATVDYGSVLTRRIRATISSISYNTSSLFDAKTGLFDDAAGAFDGEPANGAKAILYARISDNNIAWSGWFPFMITDIKCRYAQYQLRLSSTDPNINIDISELTVTAKV